MNSPTLAVSLADGRWGTARDRMRRHDLMVPFSHGEWLTANIPGARPQLRPEHGRLSLAVGSIDEILGDSSPPPEPSCDLDLGRVQVSDARLRGFRILRAAKPLRGRVRFPTGGDDPEGSESATPRRHCLGG